MTPGPHGMGSWVPGADGSGFGLAHLPYGVVLREGRPVPAVRIGEQVLDLRACAAAGVLDGGDWVGEDDLTAFLAAGHDVWGATRAAVTDLLSSVTSSRPPDGALLALAALPDPLLPVAVGDYVDCYSSLHHATAVGRLFRPDGDPLPPSWRHLPMGYHGRSGTIVPSGTPIPRPVGHRHPDVHGDGPTVGPSTSLDLELEVGFLVGGPPTVLGERIATADAGRRIFGIVLLNDWSARDLQRYETVPLGPYLGKSFATSIATWITPLAALDGLRVPAPPQAPPVAAHLGTQGDWALDLTLEVAVTPMGGDGEAVMTRVSFADMYWTMPQQLAHATSNGATVRPGDLFGSGTVSGPERGTEGCLLEATHGGAQPLELAGTTRTWLEDGDVVTLRGWGSGIDGDPLVLAEVEGTIRPPIRTPARTGRREG